MNRIVIQVDGDEIYERTHSFFLNTYEWAKNEIVNSLVCTSQFFFD